VSSTVSVLATGATLAASSLFVALSCNKESAVIYECFDNRIKFSDQGNTSHYNAAKNQNQSPYAAESKKRFHTAEKLAGLSFSGGESGSLPPTGFVFVT
jgi:hypothetical protein